MIDAIYYDGNTSRRHPVSLIIHKRVLAMRGPGVQRSERVSRMELSERLMHAPRILRFADGAFIEVDDQKRLDIMLIKNRFRDPQVVQWQNNWPFSLAALALVVGLLLSLYQWGIPAAADALATRLPAAMEKKMGEGALASMDERVLAPSKLPPELQERLRSSFAALKRPQGVNTPYQLLFRQSAVGPNAFALPNGIIVMTDEMVSVAGDEAALMGVLSHELGHLQRRHTGRMLLKSIGVGVILNLWVGDVSGALAAVPGLLLERKHSREYEREADQFAIEMMVANEQPLEPMAQLFQRMSRLHILEENKAPRQNYYLSSHPADKERINRFRAADLKQAAIKAAGT